MPAAGETINVLALAMRTGVTAAELKKTVWSYPSSVSDLDYML
jgi:glutathione reductase (NADPH)